MRKENWRIIYPLLLGIYPAVGLISVNISQIIFLAGLRTLLVSLLFSLVVYAVFCWRIRDVHKAALLSAMFFLFFYFYGHLYNEVKGWEIYNVLVGRHIVIFPLWVVIFGAGGWLINKFIQDAKLLTRVLNIISVVLVAIPIIQISIFEWKRDFPAAIPDARASQIEVNGRNGEKPSPDVYYIILDMYERDDMLLRDYDLDISGFIQSLEDLGFYVPPCSQSNYGLTALSLSSSLNMNYLDQVVPDAIKKGDPNSPNEFYLELSNSIQDSLVRQTFEARGYKTISIQNDVWWTQWSDADYFITDKSRPYEMVTNFNKITSFEILFLRTTALRVFQEVGIKWLSPLVQKVEFPEKQHADLVLLAFDELNHVPQNIPGPKFIFAHILSPHDPYVFTPDGDFVITTNPDLGYPNQIQYLNKRILALVDNIIANSKTPPIIILQGDHGKDNEVRLANFTAIYFPDGKNVVLYPTITPVNIFRLLFDNYFGENLPLLPDKSFDSVVYNTFRFEEVTYPCDANRK